MDSFANDYSEKYRAIGSNIRMVRNATGISQTQRPSLETLMRIADALGVDVVDLLKEKATPSLGKVVGELDLDWMQELNINLTKMSPSTRQSFIRSVIAMYRGYQEDLSEAI